VARYRECKFLFSVGLAQVLLQLTVGAGAHLSPAPAC